MSQQEAVQSTANDVVSDPDVGSGFCPAAVIVGHGERGGARSNALLAVQAERASRNGLQVIPAVLNGEPRLEDALAKARQCGPGRIRVYPFFMSGGYFVRQALPQRIAKAGFETCVEILAPFGETDDLIPVMAARAHFKAREAGFARRGTRVLVVGHGSKSGAPASARATRAAAQRLAARTDFHCVDLAFLEEAPFVSDILSTCGLPTIVIGFFCGDGLHAAEDVPDAIENCGRSDVVYTGPIGAEPQAADIVRSAMSCARLID